MTEETQLEEQRRILVAADTVRWPTTLMDGLRELAPVAMCGPDDVAARMEEAPWLLVVFWIQEYSDRVRDGLSAAGERRDVGGNPPLVVATDRWTDAAVADAADRGADACVPCTPGRQALTACRQALRFRQTRDEAEFLRKQVQELGVEVRQREEFIRTVFGRYMAANVVDSLMTSPDRLAMRGEKQVVTIMFSDLRSFTTISEQMSPTNLMHMLNLYFGRMIDIVETHGGIINEFFGDGMLVLFGTPVISDDHAERAVACALAMQCAMDDVNRENARHGFPNLRMGIGINTGSVVVGNIGSLKRAKYGVVGVSVNTAARIESLTSGEDVLISETTMEAVGEDQMTIGDTRSVCPKGLSAPIRVFSILGMQYRGEERHLPEAKKESMRTLATPIVVSFRAVEGSQPAGPRHDGEITRIGREQAELRMSGMLDGATTIMIEKAGDVTLRITAKVNSAPTVDGGGYLIQLQESAVLRLVTSQLRQTVVLKRAEILGTELPDWAKR